MRESDGLDAERLTWAVLLSHWMDFARGALALPGDGEPGLVRASVTDIVTLQAVWFALGQMGELDRAERAMGLDRAGVLIDRHRGAILTRFAGQPLPEGLQSLLDDVAEAFKREKERA